MTGPAAVTLNGNVSVDSLTFNTANSVTITPGTPSTSTLTFDATNHGSTAVASVVVSAGSHAINAPVALNSPTAFSLASGASLGIGGNITGGSAQSLTVGGSGGVLTLSGTNAYTGPTLVSGGTLRVGNGTSGSLGATAVSVSSGSFVVNAGGTIGNSPIAISGGSMVVNAGATVGNAPITVTGNGTLTAQPGSGTVSIGATGAGSAGATLSLGAGTTFSMVDGAIGTFNLRQQTSFAANPALTLGGATLNFELGTSAADELNVGAGQAAVSGTNTIGIAAVGASLTPGTYPLITAPAGGLTGTFQFAGGAMSAYVPAGSSFYQLTLNNSATAQTVTVSPPITTIILDTLSGPAGTSYPSHTPDINLPGGSYAFQGSNDTTNSNLQGDGSGKIGPDVGIGIPISSNGSYTKPTVDDNFTTPVFRWGTTSRIRPASAESRWASTRARWGACIAIAAVSTASG